MRIKVFTVNPINAYELKQIRNVVRDSTNPEQTFPTVFPNRYVKMEKPNKRLVKVWLDSDINTVKEYEHFYKD